jgi:hypothetical protein
MYHVGAGYPQRGQNRVSDPIELELHTDICKLLHGRWEQNLGVMSPPPPPQEQVLLTTELSIRFKFNAF